MRARSIIFLGALACSVVCAVVLTGGWLWYDHEAAGWGTPHQILGDSVEDGNMAESRWLSDALLLLLKIVPATILAIWFLASWMVFGRDAVRLGTIKSYFSTLKEWPE